MSKSEDMQESISLVVLTYNTVYKCPSLDPSCSLFLRSCSTCRANTSKTHYVWPYNIRKGARSGLYVYILLIIKVSQFHQCSSITTANRNLFLAIFHASLFFSPLGGLAKSILLFFPWGGGPQIDTPPIMVTACGLYSSSFLLLLVFVFAILVFFSFLFYLSPIHRLFTSICVKQTMLLGYIV